MMLQRAHFILFVRDQARSRDFYGAVLAQPPRLDVLGMTEFALPGGAILGLMPFAGAHRIAPAAFAATDLEQPRSELYLLVDDPLRYRQRAIAGGGREVSPFQRRDWGHDAAYVVDLDGHLVAFARVAAA